MKKATITFLVLMLITFAASAQKLVITEVDAAENNYFTKSSFNILGKKMDLSVSGNTLSVKIGGEPKLILTQHSSQSYETERKTEKGIEKFTLQVKTINSVITSAELTATIIPDNEQQQKIWWTVTARDSDTISLVTMK